MAIDTIKEHGEKEIPGFLIFSMEELSINHIALLLHEITNLEIKLLKKIIVSMKSHQVLSHKRVQYTHLPLIFVQ